MQFQILRRHRAADAENADPLHIAEIVLDLFQRRGRLQDLLRAVAIDGDAQRFARARR